MDVSGSRCISFSSVIYCFVAGNAHEVPAIMGPFFLPVFFRHDEKTMVNKRGVFQKTSYLSLVLNGPILYYRVLKGPGVSKRVITGEP